MMANCPLRILVEGRRIPNGIPFGERTETSVQMIVAVLNQLDREDQAVQELCELVVRADIRAETIAAEENVAAEQRVAFALEEEISRQTHHLVTSLGEPLFEVFFLAAAFGKTKIAADEFFIGDQSGVGSEDHIRQPGLRGDQLDLASKGFQGFSKPQPLSLCQSRQHVTGTIHPWINFVFDAVKVRRAKKELAHGLEFHFSLIDGHFCVFSSPKNSVNSRRNGSMSVTSPMA